ncbi:MAG: antibiotic biosynthesis monooxygenase, partial [Rhodobiaceae bacterium]|nr:antibiotic biosynthesis monooxygenase [Rhodobiaceae bacterium]
MKVGYIATLKVVDGKQAEFETAFAKMQEAV